MEKFKLVPFHEQSPLALLSDFSSNSPVNALRQELDALNQAAPVLSDDEIWQRYRLLFYKFFQAQGSSPLPTNTAVASLPVDTIENVIVETLPKSYQQKARILLLILKTVAPTSQLTWQPDGKIRFRNTVIENSNLAELVHFALKRRRQLQRGVPSPPAGWLEFSTVLENLPLGMRNLLKVEFTPPPPPQISSAESAGSAGGASPSKTPTPPKRGGLRPRGKAGANIKGGSQLLISAAARTESRDRQLSEKRRLSAAPESLAIPHHGEKKESDDEDDEQEKIEWYTS